MNRERDISACERETNLHTADHVVVNHSDEEEPEHPPRTKDHEVAQAEYTSTGNLCIF